MTIIAPGLNPSLRFHSVGSIGTPLELVGIESARKCTRRPVADAPSATVKKSFGNGMRHLREAIGSQRSAVAVSTAGSHETLAYPLSCSSPWRCSARALIVTRPGVRSAAWSCAVAPCASTTSRLVISVVAVGSGQPATTQTRNDEGARSESTRMSTAISPDAGACVALAGATTWTPEGSAGP